MLPPRRKRSRNEKRNGTKLHRGRRMPFSRPPKSSRAVERVASFEKESKVSDTTRTWYLFRIRLCCRLAKRNGDGANRDREGRLRNGWATRRDVVDSARACGRT